ncbi:MAG: Glutamyl-tRNA reductase [Acidimicrobiaceae bacterium]|nr:Glutamyl-tRNA reductase [Acidimicrobiaceae bacterium]
MSVVVVGLHERDAPLDLLERLAVSEQDLPKALAVLCDSPHLSEAVVLSTCMRTEVYAVLERFHDGLDDINAFFHARAGTSPAGATALEEQLVVAYDDAAARHLFEVAAGSDSAVLGEGEILRQVRHAGERARVERAAGPVLGGLFRHAIEVGKRSRTETAIARGITSLAHVAVAMTAERFAGSLDGIRVVVVGAGEMGEGMAAALARFPGIPEIVVVSRSLGRAQQLAATVGGRTADLAQLTSELAQADVMLTATTSPEVLLGAEQAAQAMAGRAARPLLVVDAAVPRDVEPAVGRVDGVTLFDLDDLRSYAEAEMQARRGELTHVSEIVEEELERYRTALLGRSVSPVVSSLRARSEQIRSDELERVAARLEHLDAADREMVEALTRRLVAKLVHEPTVQVKQAAGSPRGERLAEALRQLFDL